MTSAPLAVIRELVGAVRATRGKPVVLYHSALTADSVPVLHECLRRIGPVKALDLVLSTNGGSITSTRQVALLLREFTDHLTILVPYRARSAGTLLCLSADELVLTPISELGPVDSTMDSAGVPAPDAAGTISALDITAFRRMAQDWFGIDREEDRLQVLGLLATRIFPTSLSSFYRFDRLVREVAAELLEWQLAGDEHADERARIVDRLVSGYHSHDFVLARRDARALGLRVTDATPEEEQVLRELHHAARRPQGVVDPLPEVEVAAVIAASDFVAADTIRRPPKDRAGDQAGPGPRPPSVMNMRWEIFD